MKKNYVSVEKWWNEICGRGNWEKPREEPTQTLFFPPRNPHRVTEMQTWNPSGGRQASNHCAMEPPNYLFKIHISEIMKSKLKRKS